MTPTREFSIRVAVESDENAIWQGNFTFPCAPNHSYQEMRRQP